MSDLKLRAYQGWSAIVHPLFQFWDWWTRELIELIPAGWRQRMRGRERIMRYSRGELEIEEGSRKIQIPLDQVATHPLLASWQTLGDKTALIVLLPEAELLHKVISLPAATEPRLASVLGYELDRHTPFSAAQAGFGYRILNRDRVSSKIEVDLFVLPDSKRKPLVEVLKHIGLVPEALLPEGMQHDSTSRKTLNLQASDGGTKTARALAVRFPALILLVLVVLVAYASHQREQQIARLEAEVSIQEPLAEQARQLREEIEALESGGQYIREIKRGRPPTLILLDEMTRLLPDHTWLNRMELDGSEIRIQGESSSASELIALLEASPGFSQATFAAPVTINPRTRKERFSLTLNVTQEVAP